jgi:hypothetical protein
MLNERRRYIDHRFSPYCNSIQSLYNNMTGKVAPTRPVPEALDEQVVYFKEQIALEKAGKRKLFHSLVKIANELRDLREASEEQGRVLGDHSWHEGGMWRAPQVLPAALQNTKSIHQVDRLAHRSAISLSDLFFSLVIVTGFTRVGVAVSEQGYMTVTSCLYFAIFWTIWQKEVSFSTRFDKTDLSAQIQTLLTCFAVLFISLSVQAPITSPDASRIMLMAGAVAILQFLSHVRVAFGTCSGPLSDDGVGAQQQQMLVEHVRKYAFITMSMNLAEATVWIVGYFVVPYDWEYRWIVFLVGVLLALRVPRAFLAMDFHGM